MSLSCCSHRLDRTRHASAVSLLLLLSFAEPFQLQNNLPSKYLWLLQRSVSYVAPTHFSPMPPLIQRSVRRRCTSRSSPLLSILHLSRTPRSFKLFKLLFKTLFSPLDVLLALLLLYHHPLFAFSFFLYYLGFRFTCYRCILCSITLHAPSYCPLPLRRYLYTPFALSPPRFLRLVRFHFLLSASLASDCVLRFLPWRAVGSLRFCD